MRTAMVTVGQATRTSPPAATPASASTARTLLAGSPSAARSAGVPEMVAALAIALHLAGGAHAKDGGSGGVEARPPVKGMIVVVANGQRRRSSSCRRRSRSRRSSDRRRGGGELFEFGAFVSLALVPSVRNSLLASPLFTCHTCHTCHVV